MDRISHSPLKPKAGDTYGVCYNFDGLPSTVTSVTLHVFNSPSLPDDPQVVVITRGASGTVFCKNVSTPAGGLSQTIEDTSSNSPDHGVYLS